MSEWISIKDKQPERDGRYLVVEEHWSHWIGVDSMVDGKFNMPISHWMPLPEPPK